MKTSIISEVDKLELRLIHFGETYEKVLLIAHGYQETSADYTRLAECLSENYKVHVVIYDQREHGIHKEGVKSILVMKSENYFNR